MAECKECNDTGELVVPVSDYIRSLDVKSGNAHRPLETMKFCGCKIGKAQERKSADERFN